jgi:hypothetical protein
MFEVYDYAIAKLAVGNAGTLVSDKYYEVVIYDESNIATYGFLVEKSEFENMEGATKAIEDNIEKMKTIMAGYPGGSINDYFSNYVATHPASEIPSITKIYQNTKITEDGDVEYYYYEYDPINANEDGKPNVGTNSKMYLHKYVYDKYGNYITKERADVMGDYAREIIDTFSNYSTVIIAFTTLIVISKIESALNKKINKKEIKQN